MHSLGEQSTRQIQICYMQMSFNHLAHSHVGARLFLICTLSSLLSNFKHAIKGVLTTLLRDRASDKTEPFHNNQQKILLVKMSVHYQGQAKEYKDQICVEHWGEEEDDNINSITGGEAACANGAPLGIISKCSGSCRAGVSVVSELFQQLKRESSTDISPMAVQIYSGKGRQEWRQLGRGSGRCCCWFWDMLRRTTSPPTVANYCRCIERSWEESVHLDGWFSMIITSKIL